MTLSDLRRLVCDANVALARTGLVHGTFGNVSGADHDAGVMAIKPSGVPYDALLPEHMVAVSLATGEVVDGALRPSSDTPTHLVLYREFRCGGIVHTHSEAATALAQVHLGVRCLGTTHADHFRGDVPVTRPLREGEVAGEYEKNTGHVIVEAFRAAGIAPEEVPAVLVASHGPFTWGASPAKAVEHAEVLELLARLEISARAVSSTTQPIPAYLRDRHYLRKHGSTAYYGQQR